MDDATKKIVMAIAAGALRKLALVAAGALTTHGIAVTGSFTETFVSAGLGLGVWAYSTYGDYVKVIVLAKLEVWKAKALAQADALHKANVPGPTHQEIADKSPDPAVTAAAVAKVVTAGCILLLAMLLVAGGAAAQTKPKLTGNIINDIRQRSDSTDGVQAGSGGGKGLGDLLGALDAKVLPDLKYALALATKSNSKVTAPCYQAWIDIIETRQAAALDKDGNPLPEPDPHIITTFEKMVELRNALQPDSDFTIKCSPVATMVKRDLIGFIGVVISGGAGLATLVPGL